MSSRKTAAAKITATAPRQSAAKSPTKRAAKAEVKAKTARKPATKTVASKSAQAAVVADPPPRVIRPAPKPPSVPDNASSARARELAAQIEQAIVDDRLDVLSTETAQKLMASLCKLYAARVEAGSRETPVEEGQVVSPTGIMVTASGLLRAADLAVFELGMWQSWTGR